MSCEQYESLIGDLVDGTLDGAPRHELEAHLATCAACTRLAEELLVVRRAARGLPPMELPPTAWARVSGGRRGRTGGAADAVADGSASCCRWRLRRCWWQPSR